MGNSQSPAGDPRFTKASRAFSKQELEELQSLFVSLAAQSRSDGQFVSQPVFVAYFGIRGRLAERLFQLITQKRGDGMLTFEDLVITKGTYERGTRDDIEEFIYQLCDVNGDGIVGRYDLEAVVEAIQQTIFSTENNEIRASGAVEAFLNAATFSKEGNGLAERGMSSIDLRNWSNLLPSARKFLGSLLMPFDSGRSGFNVPQLHYPENITPDALILNKEYAWHIGGALSLHEVEEWKLLYHSSIHGLSFNTFLGNISNGDGPTVLIIKDTEGFIYGGYASQQWERHSDFYGDMKSFLFQLYPQASIYRPTGANNNLQWCAVNFSSESIPNGIGFGGRPNHFGLFLSANFDRGHTFVCTTFNSQCLSKMNKIWPEVIECWGVQVRGYQNEKPDLIKGTVLERFKEDRNMLKMVGLANSSN